MTTLFRFYLSNNPKRNVGSALLSGFQFQQARSCKTKPKKKIHSYLLTRYNEYVSKYETVLEKRFPAAIQLYRIFSIGIKEFKSDVASLIKIFKKVNSTGHISLTRREMELYHQMPRDMTRVLPVLVITALPFGGAAFPVAYMFPRLLLSSHFWSLQQRSEFAIIEHRKKLKYYRPLLRYLQLQLRPLKSNPLHKPWSHVLGQLGSGAQPTSSEILDCKALFEDGGRYCLSQLSTGHLSSLLKTHSMHRGWMRRKRLADRAMVLHHMDLAIVEEGGVSKLSSDELKKVCFLRGLNPTNMSHLDMEDWINQWLFVSVCLAKVRAPSLLLHCPVLLAYNQPSNWALLCDTRMRN